MDRYVLRYQGGGQPPAGELALIERTLRVVDRSPRMLLVEGSGSVVRQVLARLPAWMADEEVVVPIPATGPALAPRSF
jgi:hypothetical protein